MKIHVLVVDDNLDLLETISECLESEFKVSTATSASQALDKFSEDNIDMVVSDFRMPEMNGIELCQIIKDRSPHSYVPFILLTGTNDPDCEMEAFSKGADDFISKPFSTGVLIAKCRLMTRLKRLNDRLLILNKELEKQVHDQVDEIQKVNRLKRYFSPEIVRRIIEEHGASDFGELPRREEVTALFCDIRNFSEISDRIPPENVKSLLDFYLEITTEIVFANGGYIDKFLGDGILAIFPKKDSKSVAAVEDAIRSALQIKDTIWDIQSHLPQPFQSSFKIGFGINTGNVILGNVGKGQLVNYTAIGSPVNISARLQAFSENNNIIVNKESLPTHCKFEIGHHRSVKIRGIESLVEICEVLSELQ